MRLEISKFLSRFECDDFTLKLIWLSHYVSIFNSSNIPVKVVEFNNAVYDGYFVLFNSEKEASIKSEIKSLKALRDQIRTIYGLPPLQAQPQLDLFGGAL